MSFAELIREPSRIEALRLRWHRLWQETRDASIFQSYAWFSALRFASLPEMKFALIATGHDDRRAGGLLPLCIESRSGRLGTRTSWRFPVPSWVPCFAPVGPEPASTWLAALSCLLRHRGDWSDCCFEGIDRRHVDARRFETACEFRSCHPLARSADRWRVLYVDDGEAAIPTRGTAPHSVPLGRNRVVRVRPRRLQVVNGVESETSVTVLDVPHDAAAYSSGAFAEPADSVWRRALMRAGAATSQLIRYELQTADGLTAVWLVASAQRHMAVIGRWHQDAAAADVARHRLLGAIVRDARQLGVPRVWLDASIGVGEAGGLRDYCLYGPWRRRLALLTG